MIGAPVCGLLRENNTLITCTVSSHVFLVLAVHREFLPVTFPWTLSVLSWVHRDSSTWNYTSTTPLSKYLTIAKEQPCNCYFNPYIIL